MTAGSVEVRVGGRVWFDGQGWEIAELADGVVRLAADGRIRAVSIAALLASLHEISGPTEDNTSEAEFTDRWTIPAVVLAGLSTRQRDALEARLSVLRRLLEPDEHDDRSLGQRYEDLAAELGVSRRTLERQVARLSELGPAGLVDARMLQEVRRAVDPRWDSACLAVLASYSKESNPTKQSVIRRANEAFLAAVPDGKVPSAAVAYRRLDELDKGRYTFGRGEAAPVGGEAAHRCAGPAASGPARAVRADGLLPARCVRDGTGHAALGEHRADRRDGPVRPVHHRPAAAPDRRAEPGRGQCVVPDGDPADVGVAGRLSRLGHRLGLPDGIVLADPGGVLPDTIVVDHGKIYLSEHTRSVSVNGSGSRSSRRSRTSRPTSRPWNGSSGRCGSRCWSSCPATRAQMSGLAARTWRAKRSTTSASWSS